MKMMILCAVALIAGCDASSGDDENCGSWFTKCGVVLATFDEMPIHPCRPHDPETIGESFYLDDIGYCMTCDEFGNMRGDKCSITDCNYYTCPSQIANPTR